MNTEKLLEIKERIETAKTKVSELKGKREYLVSQLKDNWKCSTLKEAEKLAKKLEKEIDDLAKKIEIGLKALDKYDFDD